MSCHGGAGGGGRHRSRWERGPRLQLNAAPLAGRPWVRAAACRCARHFHRGARAIAVLRPCYRRGSAPLVPGQRRLTSVHGGARCTLVGLHSPHAQEPAAFSDANASLAANRRCDALSGPHQRDLDYLWSHLPPTGLLAVRSSPIHGPCQASRTEHWTRGAVPGRRWTRRQQRLCLFSDSPLVGLLTCSVVPTFRSRACNS